MNPVTTLDTLSATELFNVLPEASARTADVTEPQQLQRWECLNGDDRDPAEVASSGGLRAGWTYWVDDALHALVLREVAKRDGHAAEVLWDLGTEQHAVLVDMPMTPITF